MFRIRVEDSRESLMFAIALGCVLLLAISVSLVYWTHQDAGDPWEVTDVRSGAPSKVMGEGGSAKSRGAGEVSNSRALSSPNTNGDRDSERKSLWFFGTLICLLLLLFGLTFRYYSHRETKEAERRWEMSIRDFLARMEMERSNSEKGWAGGNTLWSRIWRGEGVEMSEMKRISERESSNPLRT